MASWGSILREIKEAGSTRDQIRRRYLKQLYRVTGRNVIIYYSGWLQKPGVPGTNLDDADKNGFMNAVHGLDSAKGLDLILHTPGGETAATESVVDYLRSVFGTNIRAIVPQLAMSAGTVIACACQEIIMGQQSSLGPIDPVYRGLAAHGVVEEFKRAFEDIKGKGGRIDQAKAAVWQPIIAKYQPTLIGECEKVSAWSNEMVVDWLISGMLMWHDDREAKAREIVRELGDHARTKSHARHLSIARCQEIGLNATALESVPKLEEAVLSVHHAAIHTLAGTGALKIIENHKGEAFISVVPQVMVRQ